MANRKTISAILVAVWLAMASAQAKQPSLTEFLADTYQKYAGSYAALRGGEFERLCKEHGVDATLQQNKDKFFKLLFFHELFTGSSATDCVSGGMLRIPYFWHWIAPNPRHEIQSLTAGKKLSEVKPPKRFNKYKSFADIDRRPALFLSDLVSDEPKYSHKECGNFYTFGWCSEREMAFLMLMTHYGYKGKIIQHGNHVTTLVWVEFVGQTGSPIRLVADVDNTFNEISWREAPKKSVGEWRKDMEGSTTPSSYNRWPYSKAEKSLVDNINVGAKPAARIDEMVKNYLGHAK